MKTGRYGRLSVAVKVLGLLLIGLFIFSSKGLTVEAKDFAGERYSGSYNPDIPASWNQCNHSYSGDVYPVWGETYCQSSCGAHSLTWMLLKSGVWGADKTVKDAWTFFKKNGWASEGSGGYTSMGVGAPVTENGKKIEVMDTISGAGLSGIKGWLREMYDKNYFVILNVPGHMIGFDYIDEDGDPVMLDSAELCKYLECIGNRWGHSYTAWAYKIEGSEAMGKGGASIWDGDALGKGSTDEDKNTSGGGAFPELNDQWKTPLVEYDESAVDTKGKGLNQTDPGFMGWLFR